MMTFKSIDYPNICASLFFHKEQHLDKIAYIFLEDGETKEIRLNYSDLTEKVIRLGSSFIHRQLNKQRVILLHTNSIEFIISFLACQYAGAIAVPVFPQSGKRYTEQLIHIIKDVDPTAIITEQNKAEEINHLIKGSPITVLINNSEELQANIHLPPTITSENDICLIQYTSGSTGSPKGVLITNRNLLNNQNFIQKSFACDSNSIIASWLPFYHDMGLIGNLLHAIYTGSSCILISPVHFMQSPIRWLKVISSYQVTHSGGPNFAYELCSKKIEDDEIAKLNLSAWKVAYNGSEPIRYETIKKFSSKFSSAGFSESSFFSCYGLAESTLLVCSSSLHFLEDKVLTRHPYKQLSSSSTVLVSSGYIQSDIKVKVFRPVQENRSLNTTDFDECQELEEGEICIAGPSVSTGYWNRADEGLFIKLENGEQYLKTGDLGFIHQGKLFVSGRIKEMLIVNGENFYPQDIENQVKQYTEWVEPNGIAAFSIEIDNRECLVVVVEVKRSMCYHPEISTIPILIHKNIFVHTGLQAHECLLVEPFSIPRTSSGKLRRRSCADLYTAGQLKVLASSLNHIHDEQKELGISPLIHKIKNEPNYQDIKHYLHRTLESKCTIIIPSELRLDSMELASLGIDSLKALDLVNTINHDLEINIDPYILFQQNHFSQLTLLIENLLWLKSEHSNENELTL